MRCPSIGSLATLAALLLPFALAAPTHHHKIRNADAKDVIPNSYIIVYKDIVAALAIAAHESSISSMISKWDAQFAGIGAKYNMSSFEGYQVEADSATIAQIAAAPEVAYIELDGRMYASALTTQTGSTWGLGHISHRTSGATSYIYDDTAGSGSRVYVVDTGIYIEQDEFGGRASWGTNFVSGSADTDENGHGTHCSGAIGGSTYGVSKSVNLVAVKVLDASGSGSNSGVISGIQWGTKVGIKSYGTALVKPPIGIRTSITFDPNLLANDASSNGVSAQSFLSMSLGGSYSSAVNSAVASTVNSGVTVVVAAGNSNDDASNYSPASEPSAITVGAIDQTDARASFSSYGSVLDVFAPGVNVRSSWIGSTSATNTISGTSMATPHVAGLAAYLIALEGISTPADVVARITALATSGKVRSAGSGSPNLIAYNGNGA